VTPKGSAFSYRHRLHDWRRLTDYRRRIILAEGKRSVLVKYRPAFSASCNRKILFFSDLHWRRDAAVYQEMIGDIITYTRAFEPDLILFGGDLTSSTCHLAEAMNAMKEIPGPARVAVAGNWERRRGWISAGRWRDYFALGNFDLVLQNWFLHDGLAVFGADDIKRGHPIPPDSYPDGFRILAAHNPDTVIDMGRRDILKHFPLALCGHTHGGQIRLPFWGPLKTSSNYGTKFDYGMFYNEKTGTFMIITAGMGYTMIRRRLLCRSEAALIEL
jgi:hypothetical protein